MRKLQSECEQYVKDNPDEFARSESVKFKYDLEENKMIENKQSKKKGQLDTAQAAQAQALVIKKFKKVKKDIIREEDYNTQAFICNLLG